MLFMAPDACGLINATRWGVDMLDMQPKGCRLLRIWATVQSLPHVTTGCLFLLQDDAEDFDLGIVHIFLRVFVSKRNGCCSSRIDISKARLGFRISFFCKCK